MFDIKETSQHKKDERALQYVIGNLRKHLIIYTDKIFYSLILITLLFYPVIAWSNDYDLSWMGLWRYIQFFYIFFLIPIPLTLGASAGEYLAMRRRDLILKLNWKDKLVGILVVIVIAWGLYLPVLIINFLIDIYNN